MRRHTSQKGTQQSAPSTSGRTLEPNLLAAFEPLFQHSFAHVRVHTDESAHARAVEHAARAFAQDSDLFFKAGTFAPHTPEGQQLIAHELAHVVQNDRFGASSDTRTSRSTDASETEARGAAARAMSGQPVMIQQVPSASVARDGDDESVTPPIYPFLPPVPNVQLTPPSLLGQADHGPSLGPIGPRVGPGGGAAAPFNFSVLPGDPLGGGLGYGQPLSPMFPRLDSGSLDIPRLDAPPQGPSLPGAWGQWGFGLQGGYFGQTDAGQPDWMLGAGIRGPLPF